MRMFKFLFQPTTFAALALVACMHTQEQRRKIDYQDTADDRIDQMEKNIANLKTRRDEQISGEPRQELTSALGTLRDETKEARTELNELKHRNADNWVEKKVQLDKQMTKMDKAYTKTLQVFEAH